MRFVLLLSMVLPAAAAAQQTPAMEQQTLAHAAAWLWSQQASDGGWHSTTYGLLKSGQACTPFVLYALLQVPENVVARPQGSVQRALEFLRRHMNSAGALGLADPEVLEYPNYATAYALQCFVTARRAEDEPLIARMRDYLIAQQFQAANGFDFQHLAHGGWGFGGPVRAERPGHMDLAHTRRALEALRAADNVRRDTFQRAEHFLRLVQRHPQERRPQPSLAHQPSAASAVYDGGFYFSPLVLAANKAGEQSGPSPHFRSYATATCDGLLALLAAGVPPADERVRKAVEWLEAHPRIDDPQGIPPNHPEPWRDALHFYHLAVRSEAYAALSWPGNWRELVQSHLAALQQSDGRFINARSPLMKEDDPLLCTSLAVIALEHAR